ncbi:hypothetical protein M885DRAFT_560176 [Pelagophyceae sp. CCMP2097]|nr:hypothetical protein M885DRAFT_560176 [Pelagophyceae sp. CCMP2097]
MRLADVAVVNSVDAAKAVSDHLLEVLASDPLQVFSVEVTCDLDLKNQGPVGNGRLTSLSLYAGPNFWFTGADGNGHVRGAALFVDVLDREVLHAFKPWLESRAKKVWHDYSISRHVVEQGGLLLGGFSGDVKHMSAFRDPQRTDGALSALAYDLIGLEPIDDLANGFPVFFKQLERSGLDAMKQWVSRTQGEPETRDAFISYAAYEARTLWQVRQALQKKLEAEEWRPNIPLSADAVVETDADAYASFFVPLCQVLTEMERHGVFVDASRLDAAISLAEDRKVHLREQFSEWAFKALGAVGAYVNPSSTAQLQTLLYGGIKKPMGRILHKRKERVPSQRLFDIPKGAVEATRQRNAKLVSLMPDSFAMLGVVNVVAMRATCQARGLSRQGSLDDLIDAVLEDADRLQPTQGAVDETQGALWDKFQGEVDLSQVRAQTLFLLKAVGQGRLAPSSFTGDGHPAVLSSDLYKFAGTDPANGVFGTAYDLLGGTKSAAELCLAVHCIWQLQQVEKAMGTLLRPLSQHADGHSRVHAQFNVVSATGRISSKRPCLENQLSAGKDVYNVRAAFRAAPNCALIVADYANLELSLLAHLSGCPSMLASFAAGGCFHARTAAALHAHVSTALAAGEVVVEADAAGTPLLSDVFLKECTEARMVNFAMTKNQRAKALASHLKCDLDAAKALITAWHAAFPGVKEWRSKNEKAAEGQGYVTTLLGRRRYLPLAKSKVADERNDALRFARHAPLQGSTADMLTVAVVQLSRSETLRLLGWKLLAQVQDGVLFEGPAASAEEAQLEVQRVMELRDGGVSLRLQLRVDARVADDWAEARRMKDEGR